MHRTKAASSPESPKHQMPKEEKQITQQKKDIEVQKMETKIEEVKVPEKKKGHYKSASTSTFASSQEPEKIADKYLLEIPPSINQRSPSFDAKQEEKEGDQNDISKRTAK